VKKKKGIDLSKQKSLMSHLHHTCEHAKIYTMESKEKDMLISIAFVPNTPPFELTIQYKQLNEIVSKIYSKVLQLVE
jgi:molecular chaperone DnaK (HSP70)